MLRLVFLVLSLFSPAASEAAESLCASVASELEPSLRAFEAPSNARPFDRVSIRNAVGKRSAAGLDFGAALDDADLSSFPLSAKDRASFKGAIGLIYRAGGSGGLAMLDSVGGTAHCHWPFLFDLASGDPKPLQTPEPDDPFSMCLTGGVALGAAAGKPFYAETTDDLAETDTLKLSSLENGALAERCTISAAYAIVYETAESFCQAPALCTDYAEKAARWAADFNNAGGVIGDASLARTADKPNSGSSELPLFGAKESALVPEPFGFDGTESWFKVKYDANVDALRIGIAAEGPENMANWRAFTLAVLYNNGKPVASFVVEKRRGAFRSLTFTDKD